MTESRKSYVIGEVERLINTDARDSLARRLGYANGANLARSLQRWDRADLARHLDLISLDNSRK